VNHHPEVWQVKDGTWRAWHDGMLEAGATPLEAISKVREKLLRRLALRYLELKLEWEQLVELIKGAA